MGRMWMCARRSTYTYEEWIAVDMDYNGYGGGYDCYICNPRQESIRYLIKPQQVIRALSKKDLQCIIRAQSDLDDERNRVLYHLTKLTSALRDIILEC
jgi:hypothetical protein